MLLLDQGERQFNTRLNKSGRLGVTGGRQMTGSNRRRVCSQKVILHGIDSSMTQHRIGRRGAIQLLGTAAGAALLPDGSNAATPAPRQNKFIYCLNTATIRAHKLGIVKEFEVVSQAGFQGVEIWMDTLQDYLAGGGSLADLRKRIADLDITIENAIGFDQWIVDDDTVRRQALEQLKKEMALLAELGCKRIAAPPSGATDQPGLDLHKAAARYRAILELGDAAGVVPQLELWGFSANLNKLSDVLFVAVESGHPKAKVLLDNYHLYKGGTSIDSLHLIDPSATDIFHVNDFPGIARETITDADRIMPGDGISPLKNVLRILRSDSRPLILSVEIFNKKYYAQDALQVAKLAFGKTKSVIAAIQGGN